MAKKRRGITLLTEEHLLEIERKAAESKARAEEKKRRKKERRENEEEVKDNEDEPKASPRLEAGKKLPPRFADIDEKLIAKPLDDIDDYYADKNVSDTPQGPPSWNYSESENKLRCKSCLPDFK